MSHQDQNKQPFEQSLDGVFKEVSNETTSDMLDQSILNMAEKHHAVKLGFWDRLFRSKQMKYFVSASAALVMTVGIARFMVYLGKTDQGPAQSPNIVAENQSDSADFAFEMEVHDEAITYDSEAEDSLVAKRSAYTSEKAKPIAVPELITNDEMRELLKDSPELAKADKAEALNGEEHSIVTTGSRMKRTELKAAVSVATVANKTSESEAKKINFDGDDHHSAGVLDEALDDSPKPENWLAEISALLEKGDKSQAKEEWSQFKNIYPNYSINEDLRQKFKNMGLFD